MTSAARRDPSELTFDDVAKLDSSDLSGHLIWHTTAKWQRLVNEALAPLDVTYLQLRVITQAWVLRQETGEFPSQREIADRAGMEQMTTSVAVTNFIGKGMVKRHADATDKRLRRVAVTPAGEALVRAAVPIAYRVSSEFFAEAQAIDGFMEALRALSKQD